MPILFSSLHAEGPAYTPFGLPFPAKAARSAISGDNFMTDGWK
jgi:hypothetical protein